jgi:hypothetical protein
MSAVSQAANQFLADFAGGQQFNPLMGLDQQVAIDMDIMAGPVRNMQRRARDYRFSEPGNVGQNRQRALRELEAAKIMAPYWIHPSY